ncbi:MULTISPECIES: MFS transporter [Fibrobacter]|nr:MULTISPECIES: MFS transporter [Fibrobacter]MDD7298749.1 MFS transporter [Fibrobacter intestinalis]
MEWYIGTIISTLCDMEKLWSKTFVLVGITNFLLFFAFYELLPILPLYILEKFHTGATVSGIIISLYTIGALFCRPFAGFLVDSFSRKPLYLVMYFFFASMFIGYVAAGTLFLLGLFRFLHGICFGIASTAGNTIAIDVLPSSRRGEGIGYFGVTTNLAFATGPMTGMFLYEAFGEIPVIALSVVLCVIGLILILCVHPKARPIKKNAAPISLDRFFLTRAIPQFFNMLLIGCAYGPLTNYIALYAKQNSLSGSGYFYALIAIGLIASRLLTGKLIDRGYLTRLISIGLLFVSSAYLLFSAFPHPFLFLASAFFIGCGLGLVFPGYQTMCVNLARHDQRGTATSTYLTGWDLGIGLGILVGGPLAESFSYATMFFCCGVLLLASFLFFVKKTAPHYRKNRLTES